MCVCVPYICVQVCGVGGMRVMRVMHKELKNESGEGRRERCSVCSKLMTWWGRDIAYTGLLRDELHARQQRQTDGQRLDGGVNIHRVDVCTYLCVCACVCVLCVRV